MDKQSQPDKFNRIDGLTSIRAFAALHVVFYHMWGFFLPLNQDSWFYHHVINIGYIGVNLFFILSGYILSYVYLLPSPDTTIDKLRFWKARFARVYPVYAFAFFLEIPLVIKHIFERTDHLRETAIAFVTLIANLSLIQAWDQVLKWRWNYPSWTLSVEAFFYFLFPFLSVWLWKKTQKGGLFVPALGCYLLLLFPTLSWWFFHPNGPGDSSPEWMFVNPAFRNPEFMLGVFLMRWQTRIDAGKEKNWLGPFLFWGGLACLLIGFAGSQLVPVYVLRSGILDPIFMSLILGIALSKGSISSLLSARPLVLLGEASYAIYILQAPIQEWVIQAGLLFNIEFATAANKTNHPLALLLFLVLLIGASILSFKYIEIPARDKIRKIKIVLPRWISKRNHPTGA